MLSAPLTAEEWVNRDELGMLLDLGVVAPAATSS